MAVDKEPTGEDEIPVVDSDTETETDTDREIIGGVHLELVADVSVSGADDEETESDVAAEPVRVVEVKQKSSRIPAKKKKRLIGEEVCFICFDGGELFLCDRRGCNKGYHSSCVNRDEAFFRAKGVWTCGESHGWHICSICEKDAYYKCYTCPYSLCKGCVKDGIIFCVRGNKGFCESCMEVVKLIENINQGNKEVQVDFDDKSSWEFLFKDYYVELKEKLALSLDELSQAKNPWKSSDALTVKEKSPNEQFNVDYDASSSDSDNPSMHLEEARLSKKRSNKRSRTTKQKSLDGHFDVHDDESSGSDKIRETKKRLNYGKLKSLDGHFDVHDDESSGSDKIRETKKRLNYGKLKSLDGHFDVHYDGSSGSDTPSRNLEARKPIKRKAKKRLKKLTDVDAEEISVNQNQWASKELLEFVMHTRNGDGSISSQSVVQELLLEYITRNKLRDPQWKSQINCDARLESLFGKACVGHFEMFKLLDSHFLIKVDSKDDDTEVNDDGGNDRKRKIRKKGDERGPQSNLSDYAAIDMHNINLIYLRRKLMEDLLEDSDSFSDKVVGTFVRIRISASSQKQDVYRLVQVVGTIKVDEPYEIGRRTSDIVLEILNLDKTELTPIDSISNQPFSEGDVLDKALALHRAKVTDWLETEIVRLSHLRDRASDLGRKKEYPLALLKTPEERLRRLEEVPEIHADPSMDPSNKYEDDEDTETDDNKRAEDSGCTLETPDDKDEQHMSNLEKPSAATTGETIGLNSRSALAKSEPVVPVPSDKLELPRSITSCKAIELDSDPVIKSEPSDGIVSEALQADNLKKPSSATSCGTGGLTSPPISEALAKSNPEAEIGLISGETEKIWHYQDPYNKVQGPFSMAQLQRWSNKGYFPTDLRIWKRTKKQDDSILLTDELAGKFEKEPSKVDNGLPMANSFLKPDNVDRDTVGGTGVDMGARMGASSVGVEVNSQAYDQGGGVTSTLPNTTGNSPTQGVSAYPPLYPWIAPAHELSRPPLLPPNVPSENSTPAQGAVWEPMPGNPNAGWGGPVPESRSTNWGATILGPPPRNPNPSWALPLGNANPGWVVPQPRNPGPIAQRPVPGYGNPAWVVPPGNPGTYFQGPPPPPGNSDPGWVLQGWNLRTNAQAPTPPPPPRRSANLGWVAPGNHRFNGQAPPLLPTPPPLPPPPPPPGNANPGWFSPTGNRGMQGSV
ncbi:hypothetical protein LguiA_009016 [Lonicera macranthoides]